MRPDPCRRTDLLLSLLSLLLLSVSSPLLLFFDLGSLAFVDWDCASSFGFPELRFVLLLVRRFSCCECFTTRKTFRQNQTDRFYPSHFLSLSLHVCPVSLVCFLFSPSVPAVCLDLQSTMLLTPVIAFRYSTERLYPKFWVGTSKARPTQDRLDVEGTLCEFCRKHRTNERLRTNTTIDGLTNTVPSLFFVGVFRPSCFVAVRFSFVLLGPLFFSLSLCLSLSASCCAVAVVAFFQTKNRNDPNQQCYAKW